MVLIVVKSESKYGLFDLLAEPKHHFLNPIHWFRYNGILLVSFNSPWYFKSRKFLACTFVQIKHSIGMIMQKCWRNVDRLFTLYTPPYDMSLTLWPSHYKYSFGFAYGIYAHCYCTFWYILYTTKWVCCIFTC